MEVEHRRGVEVGEDVAVDDQQRLVHVGDRTQRSGRAERLGLPLPAARRVRRESSAPARSRSGSARRDDRCRRRPAARRCAPASRRSAPGSDGRRPARAASAGPSCRGAAGCRGRRRARRLSAGRDRCRQSRTHRRGSDGGWRAARRSSRSSPVRRSTAGRQPVSSVVGAESHSSRGTSLSPGRTRSGSSSISSFVPTSSPISSTSSPTETSLPLPS